MSKSDLDGLETMAHAERCGWSALTGRSFPLRVAKRLEAKGWAESKMCSKVDADGWILHGHRERLGFSLTVDGEGALARARKPGVATGRPRARARKLWARPGACSESPETIGPSCSATTWPCKRCAEEFTSKTVGPGGKRGETLTSTTRTLPIAKAQTLPTPSLRPSLSQTPHQEAVAPMDSAVPKWCAKCRSRSCRCRGERAFPMSDRDKARAEFYGDEHPDSLSEWPCQDSLGGTMPYSDSATCTHQPCRDALEEYLADAASPGARRPERISAAMDALRRVQERVDGVVRGGPPERVEIQ